jgi:hypothetical protein
MKEWLILNGHAKNMADAGLFSRKQWNKLHKEAIRAGKNIPVQKKQTTIKELSKPVEVVTERNKSPKGIVNKEDPIKAAPMDRTVPQIREVQKNEYLKSIPQVDNSPILKQSPEAKWLVKNGYALNETLATSITRKEYNEARSKGKFKNKSSLPQGIKKKEFVFDKKIWKTALDISGKTEQRKNRSETGRTKPIPAAQDSTINSALSSTFKFANQFSFLKKAGLDGDAFTQKGMRREFDNYGLEKYRDKGKQGKAISYWETSILNKNNVYKKKHKDVMNWLNSKEGEKVKKQVVKQIKPKKTFASGGFTRPMRFPRLNFARGMMPIKQRGRSNNLYDEKSKSLLGSQFSKFSTNLSQYKSNVTQGTMRNRKADIKGRGITSLDGKKMFNIPKSRGRKEALAEIKQYINSDIFKMLPPQIKTKVEKYYQKQSKDFRDSEYLRHSKNPNFEGVIKNYADGYISNFSKPLQEAVLREQSALKERGIPSSAIKVEQSNELKDSKNPMGLAVTNRVDEPRGVNQGISRSRKMGVNPKTHGAAEGMVPNFAVGAVLGNLLRMGAGGLGKLAKSLKGRVTGEDAGGMGDFLLFSLLSSIGTEFLKPEDGSPMGAGANIASGALTGASFGSLLGLPGTIAGGLAGGAYGLGKSFLGGDGEQETFESFNLIKEAKEDLDKAMQDVQAISNFTDKVATLDQAMEAQDFRVVQAIQQEMFESVSAIQDSGLRQEMMELANSGINASDKIEILKQRMNSLSSTLEVTAQFTKAAETIFEERKKNKGFFYDDPSFSGAGGGKKLTQTADIAGDAFTQAIIRVATEDLSDLKIAQSIVDSNNEGRPMFGDDRKNYDNAEDYLQDPLNQKRVSLVRREKEADALKVFLDDFRIAQELTEKAKKEADKKRKDASKQRQQYLPYRSVMKSDDLPEGPASNTSGEMQEIFDKMDSGILRTLLNQTPTGKKISENKDDKEMIEAIVDEMKVNAKFGAEIAERLQENLDKAGEDIENFTNGLVKAEQQTKAFESGSQKAARAIEEVIQYQHQSSMVLAKWNRALEFNARTLETQATDAKELFNYQLGTGQITANQFIGKSGQVDQIQINQSLFNDLQTQFIQTFQAALPELQEYVFSNLFTDDELTDAGFKKPEPQSMEGRGKQIYDEKTSPQDTAIMQLWQNQILPTLQSGNMSTEQQTAIVNQLSQYGQKGTMLAEKLNFIMEGFRMESKLAADKLNMAMARNRAEVGQRVLGKRADSLMTPGEKQGLEERMREVNFDPIAGRSPFEGVDMTNSVQEGEYKLKFDNMSPTDSYAEARIEQMRRELADRFDINPEVFGSPFGDTGQSDRFLADASIRELFELLRNMARERGDSGAILDQLYKAEQDALNENREHWNNVMQYEDLAQEQARQILEQEGKASQEMIKLLAKDPEERTSLELQTLNGTMASIQSDGISIKNIDVLAEAIIKGLGGEPIKLKNPEVPPNKPLTGEPRAEPPPRVGGNKPPSGNLPNPFIKPPWAIRGDPPPSQLPKPVLNNSPVRGPVAPNSPSMPEPPPPLAPEPNENNTALIEALTKVGEKLIEFSESATSINTSIESLNEGFAQIGESFESFTETGNALSESFQSLSGGISELNTAMLGLPTELSAQLSDLVFQHNVTGNMTFDFSSVEIENAIGPVVRREFESAIMNGAIIPRIAAAVRALIDPQGSIPQ